MFPQGLARFAAQLVPLSATTQDTSALGTSARICGRLWDVMTLILDRGVDGGVVVNWGLPTSTARQAV